MSVSYVVHFSVAAGVVVFECMLVNSFAARFLAPNATPLT